MTTLLAPMKTDRSPLAVSTPTDFEIWREDGVTHLRALRTTLDSLEDNRWAIGDWLIDGEKRFGQKAYEEAERLTGWERGTLYNIVWVATRFPTPSLRSETGLKWSHFKELARIDDKQARETLFQHFNDGLPHSVVKIRVSVDKCVRKIGQRKDPNNSRRPKTLVQLQVSLEPSERDLVISLAKAANKTPNLFLRDVVLRYFKQHKKLVGSRRNNKSIRPRKIGSAS